MANWRPLSRRGQPDPRLDEPSEGLPPYLAGPLIDWLGETFRTGQWVNEVALQRLQLRFKLDEPLNWRTPETALADLLDRVGNDETFGLDVIDYVLQHIREVTRRTTGTHTREVGVAHALLRAGGSAWEVSTTEDGKAYRLSRRAVGPVREAIESVPAPTRAHQHLVAAWNRLSGRSPDESGAYRESVRAVEAIAKPVILPANERATLGTMIAALRDKPEKWTTRLGTVDDISRMMEAVWIGQLDRHGTDDESVPLNVSAEEADAAFSTCLNLVRLFAGGHVRSARASET